MGPEIKRPSSPGYFGRMEIESRRITSRLLHNPQGVTVVAGDHGRCRPQEVSVAVVGVSITVFAASATPPPCECNLEHRRVISLASDMQHLLPAPMPNREFRSASRRLALRCLWVGLQPDISSTRFDPRPADWPGDAWASRARQASKAFQSAPGRLAGRCPSPARSVDQVRVSIRARPIGRAMQHARHADSQRLSVSIRARPIGRAMPGALQ